MSTLHQLQNGLLQAWDNLSEGWHYLSERASNALTRFSPTRNSNQLETIEEQLIDRASRWGLLSAEIYEEDDDLVVKLEVPGMNADDFDIQIKDDTLIVRGEKKVEKITKKEGYHMTECAYGQFERAIQLPTSVDENKAKAKYRKGILCIHVPKHPASIKRVIKVNS